MYLHFVALDNYQESNFVMERTNGMAGFLFLYFESPCNLLINNDNYSINKPSVILICTNTPFKYFPTATEYIDNYLHFEVEDSPGFLEELTFPCNIPFQISNDKSINKLLEHILEEDNPENKYSRKTIALLIRLLMLKVGEEWEILQQKHETLPHYENLLDIRNQITSSPYKNWKVDELAEQAHLSYAYFQVMYKKAFGISCINDVINTKVAHAKELLASTDLPVNQIAVELGYNDVYHFIRQFKKNTGLTPGVFRKRNIY